MECQCIGKRQQFPKHLTKSKKIVYIGLTRLFVNYFIAKQYFFSLQGFWNLTNILLSFTANVTPLVVRHTVLYVDKLDNLLAADWKHYRTTLSKIALRGG